MALGTWERLWEKTYNTSLAGIVAALLLRDVGRVSAHRGRQHGHAVALRAEYEAGGTHAVVHAVKVNGADPVPVLDRVVEPACLGRHARIGNQHIQATKVVRDGSDSCLDGLVVTHVDLVGPDLHVEVVRDLAGQRLGLGRREVPKREL